MNASYTFLPWLRRGVANTITSADGADTGSVRATTHVDLRLTATPVGGGGAIVQDVGQDVALYGPGDIVGIDSRAVVRTEPRDWVTNFEPNYLAAIDFCDEDFPWRYTPAAPGGPDPVGGANLRLRPWIMLVVLKETEFADGKDLTGKPLPYITVADPSVLPVAADLWAWAHVHFNQRLAADANEVVSTDINAVLTRAQAAIDADPDIAYSRIVCPRRLEANTPYHAFVIPVFESGRLAGLGLSPQDAPLATYSAWTAYEGQKDPANFPIYYRWYFRTGSVGDFEYLVDMLSPKPVDSTVGVRDMDVQYPGSGLPGIDTAELQGVLRLGGVLRVPDADLTPAQLDQRREFDQWDQPGYPQVFERKLADFINLADDYSRADASSANAEVQLGEGDPDPLITPPLYGRWHSLTQRLLVDAGGNAVPNTGNWVHRLNLDPLYRVPAGLGAQVVEKNAESYMNAAWEQVGDVLAANAKIRRLHLARALSGRWYDAHLVPLAKIVPESAYLLTGPVSKKILVAGRTIAYTQTRSLLGSTLTSTALRRVTRSGSRLIRALPFTAEVTRLNLLTRVGDGAVAAAVAKQVPANLPTTAQARAAAATAIDIPVPGSGVPSGIVSLLQQFPGAAYFVGAGALVIALLLALLLPSIGLVLGVAVAGIGATLYLQIQRWQAAIAQKAAATATATATKAAVVSALDSATQTSAAVSSLPQSSNFVLSEPGSNVSNTSGGPDSVVATRFKSALQDSFNLLQVSAAADVSAPRLQFAVSDFATAAVAAINPDTTIVKRGFASISIPAWARPGPAEADSEVMAYPRIDLPMYRPLQDLSIELFLPNINRVAPNSITLIETNRKFLEAYMVGLNHEFARKLLWREFPTDQRGSYFRQFWDPAPYFDTANLDSAALREKLYDIPPIHLWSLDSQLGQHPNRQPTGGAGEDIVLVIRGELLKKYPTAVVYAQRAQWQMKPDGSIDATKPRQLVALTDAEAQVPPPAKVRTPLYEAKADPDIYFFGFDLTGEEVRGGTGAKPQDDPGWFFVLKERPGEPRFGLELTRNGKPSTFDQLTWNDAIPGGAAGQSLPANALANIALAASQGDVDQQQQHAEDLLVSTATVSSARWAYLLFRAPVMVAVHGARLLGSGAD
jgi:hypothetical protein